MILKLLVLTNDRYLEKLIAENERLRNSDVAASSAPASEATVPNDVHESPDGSQVLQNPLFKERPWFHNVSSLDMPIHIGEATDAAFATRFRQTLGTVCTSHLPRTSYSADIPSPTLAESQYRWPSPARARFLVKVAVSTVCRYYHIVRKSAIRESLEIAIKNEGRGDRFAISRLLALFALGEVYSARIAGQGASFPGLTYFLQAKSKLDIPAERPQSGSIEIMLLFVSILAIISCVYTYQSDRSAYTRTR